MNASADWESVKALFRQSLDQADDTRDAWLASQCAEDHSLLAEVRALLAARLNASGILDDAAALLGSLMPAEAVVPSIASIGPYCLLRVLGEGGMGRVYLAERADGQFQQQVALKIIRSELVTPELHLRFLRERDTLARLIHPNIAHLLDGGVSENGEPYFTLEFIEGEPITSWCDAHRLDIRARVRLLLKICDAVQYAHRNLIVHRDLKPSNILVTVAGEPKLLDFGIAKTLTEESGLPGLTGTQAQPMTREYAAPEQVLGEPVSTATDVHALGVILYILLCGKMPYRRAALGQTGWAKAILEERPESLDRALDRTISSDASDKPQGSPPASSAALDAQALAAARSSSVAALRRSLRGDLERIVQRALAKAPEARYAAASAMAEDLNAYVEGRAISGGTRTYQLRKFVRRHWLPLAAAAVLLGVILLSAFMMVWQAQRIQREAQTTAEIKDFLLGLFHDANPNVTKGKLFTVRDLVDRGRQRLDRVPLAQVHLRAELQNVLGTIYYYLGYHKDAAALHEQAFAAFAAAPDDVLLAASAERFEATELATLGDNDRAQRLADDAIERLRALANPPAHDLARALSTAGWIAKKRADTTRSRQLATEALVLAQRPPVDDELMYLALSQKGATERLAHDDVGAAQDYANALDLSIKLFGRDDQETLNTEQLLGTALHNLNHYEQAQPHLQAAADISRRIFGETTNHTLGAEEMLALNESAGGHCKEAAARLQRALAVAEARVPRDENQLAEIQLNYGEQVADLGQLELAERVLAAATNFLREHTGSPAQETAEALSTLGYVHHRQGKHELAESEQREALALMASAHDDDVSLELARLSETLTARGKLDEALQSGRDARDRAIRISGERSHAAALAHRAYSLALIAAHQPAPAEAELRAALSIYSSLVPPQGMHPLSADARLALADLLAERMEGRDEARRLLTEVLSLHEESGGADDPPARKARDILDRLQRSR